jgi:hypothetical protein
MNEYNVNLTGLGTFIVTASVYKVPNTKKSIECEIEITKVKKFDDFLEDYQVYVPSKEEKALIEKEIAISFFNNLH